MTRVDEESILYDSRSGKVHLLNRTGAVIWEILDGNHSIEDIAVVLEEEFGENPETIRNDLDEFLKHLVKQGLLAE